MNNKLEQLKCYELLSWNYAYDHNITDIDEVADIDADIRQCQFEASAYRDMDCDAISTIIEHLQRRGARGDILSEPLNVDYDIITASTIEQAKMVVAVYRCEDEEVYNLIQNNYLKDEYYTAVCIDLEIIKMDIDKYIIFDKIKVL